MQFNDITVGGIRVAHEIINLEYQYRRLQAILDWVIQNNNLKTPDGGTISDIEDSVLAFLNEKYPDAGLKKTVDENAMQYEYEQAVQIIVSIAKSHGTNVEVKRLSDRELSIESSLGLPDSAKALIMATANKVNCNVSFR